MATKQDQLAEMQGWYGPFTIAERVLQKIWLRREFDQAGLRLLDGRALVIRAPGSWNLLEGPDFREARLVLGDRSVTGDVEVHFHSADWHAHHHDEDPAYGNVALHVILFPPGSGERPARRRDGSAIPTLVLLPLLTRGLEEYAADDALEKLTERDAMEQISGLAALSRPRLEGMLRGHARERWRMKVRFAALRIAKLGWQEAAHHAALEILGYKRNRVPMLAAATKHPLDCWRRGLSAEELVAERAAEWQLHAIRPANHPVRRLRQYGEWVRARPDWPERLCNLRAGGEDAGETPDFRRRFGLGRLRAQWLAGMTAGTVGGSRFDTMVCDGFLPLLAAETAVDLSDLWFHWFLGDVPDGLHGALVTLGLAGVPGKPFCHGWAQGFLGWLTERESRASGWPTENLPGLDKR